MVNKDRLPWHPAISVSTSTLCKDAFCITHEHSQSNTSSTVEYGILETVGKLTNYTAYLPSK